MYKRFSVLVIQAQKRSHNDTPSRLSKVAVIKIFYNFNSSQAYSLVISNYKTDKKIRPEFF